MRMLRPSAFVMKLCASAVLFLVLGLQGQTPAIDWFTGGAELTPADVQAARAKAESVSKAVPETVEEDSPEARLRAALERRFALLDELDGLLARQAELRERIATFPNRVEGLQAELALLEAAPRPQVPDSATTVGYASLEAEVAVLRKEVETVQAGLDAAMRRQDRSSEMRSANGQRAVEARKRLTDLRARAEAESSGPGRDVLELQAANAELDASVAEARDRLMDEELEGDAVLGPFRNVSLTLAELRLDRKEVELAHYGEALQLVLQVERDRSELELAAKEAQAETAEDPFERFVAGWELSVARSEASLAEAEPFLVDVSIEAAEQQERLGNDKKELERLQADVAQSGTGGAVGAAIRRVFLQLGPRRKTIELALKPRFEQRVADFSDRRFEVDQLLYGLSERWAAETAEIFPEDLGASGPRQRRTRELRDELRKALQVERTALTGAINGLRQLRDVQRERRSVLGELEGFIHAKVFWIQDRRPLWSAATISAVPEELALLGEAVRGPLAGDWSVLLGSTGWRELLPFGAALVVLLAVAIFLRRRLRRVLTSSQTTGRQSPWRSGGRAAVALLQSALLPACFLALAALAPTLDFPIETETALVSSLRVLAAAFFLSLAGQTFLGRAGLAVTMHHAPEDLAERGRRVVRLLFVGLLALGLPWSVLSSGMFAVEVFPRLLLTVLFVVVAWATFRSFSGASHAARFVVGKSDGMATARALRLWSVFLGLAVLAIPLLEISGRRFAASAVSWSLGRTVVTVLILALAYRSLGSVVDRALTASKRKRKKRSSEAPEEDAGSKRQRAEQFRGFLRATCVLTGAWSVVSYWGLNDQVLGAMKGWHLYKAGLDPIDGSQVWVTAWDVSFSLGVLLATIWFLRHLPGIYELAVFPRFNLDRGLRYAIVTMSRYGLFFLGALISLRALRIDFSSLGWLVAAMGVGLGFGLQEIVSNFVSGIILLVERPIRVGDLVTVGDVVGNIQRINIRATTVLNLDRQEVIVPNRSLIAQNVTNWTLASKLLRLNIPIGVAYGSDVERVREVLLEAVDGEPEVLKEPPPQVLFMVHGESSLDYEVRVFINDANQRFPVVDRVNRAINRALAENGIEIPFPQRDIHIRSTVVDKPAGSAS